MKFITLALCIWLVFCYDFQGLKATFLSHFKVKNDIYKEREISRCLWVDHCLCEVQQLEVDNKFIPIFFWGQCNFMLITFLSRELNFGWFWRPFDLMVHLQKYYLPLLCFQKSPIPTQWIFQWLSGYSSSWLAAGNSQEEEPSSVLETRCHPDQTTMQRHIFDDVVTSCSKNGKKSRKQRILECFI